MPKRFIITGVMGAGKSMSETIGLPAVLLIFLLIIF